MKLNFTIVFEELLFITFYHLSVGVHSEEVGHVRNIRAQVMRAVFDYVSSRLEAPAQHLAPLRRSLSNRGKWSLSKEIVMLWCKGLWSDIMLYICDV